ncbi:YitT family protein [bacterium]|nr:YitT family protein [bacterium]
MFKKHLIRNAIGIAIGSILYGMGYSWFLIPYKISPGGVGGLSQIFFHIFGLPAGVCMLVMNIPLFIIGVKVIGRQFGIGTFFGMLMGSIFTDILSVKNLYNWGFLTNILEQYNAGKPIAAWAMTDNVLLAAIAGAILMGSGIGIIFRFRGSTGGTDIPAAIIKKYFNTSMTMAYLMIETGIIFTIGIVFKDPNLIIWGFFTLFIASRMCDLAAEGLPYVKGAFIISNKSDEIKQKILDGLERGVTILHGEGGYKGEKKNILLCAINRRQVYSLRDIVQEIDPQAFVILYDINDVMGYRFKTRQLQMGDSK